MSTALNIDGITKSFGELTALDNVSLQINEGETYGLLGPNGAGKSTLINIISGVLGPDSGQIEYFGESLVEPTIEFKKSLGVIPQEISLYDKLSARENLEFYGKLYGLEGTVLNERIQENLDLVGLTDRAKDRIGNYSGGMKRRINIAASILHQPKFILMDEPTVGIDPQSRNLIFEVIEKLHDNGVTIIYTSHYMEEVERLCQTIAILDHGKVIALGTREELIEIVGGIDNVEIELSADNIDEILVGFDEMSPILTDGTLILKTEGASGKLEGIISKLSGFGAQIKKVHVREPNLENVFLHLTGKDLRD